MRTTIKIDDTLLAEAKSRAADSGRTLILLDVNVLVQAFHEGAPRHGEYRAWLESAIESGSEWITADRDFSRSPGLRWHHPLSAG